MREVEKRPTRGKKKTVDKNGFVSTLIGLKTSTPEHGATIRAHHHIKPSKFFVHKSKI
jgi:hypothetical protein